MPLLFYLRMSNSENWCLFCLWDWWYWLPFQLLKPHYLKPCCSLHPEKKRNNYKIVTWSQYHQYHWRWKWDMFSYLGQIGESHKNCKYDTNIRTERFFKCFFWHCNWSWKCGHSICVVYNLQARAKQVCCQNCLQCSVKVYIIMKLFTLIASNFNFRKLLPFKKLWPVFKHLHLQ